jgi:hypothetical protein
MTFRGVDICKQPSKVIEKNLFPMLPGHRLPVPNYRNRMDPGTKKSELLEEVSNENARIPLTMLSQTLLKLTIYLFRTKTGLTLMAKASPQVTASTY